jgi:hypothetical protein
LSFTFTAIKANGKIGLEQLTTYNEITFLKLAYNTVYLHFFFLTSFVTNRLLIKVLGKEMWVEKEGEGKGNWLLILKLSE